MSEEIQTLCVSLSVLDLSNSRYRKTLRSTSNISSPLLKSCWSVRAFCLLPADVTSTRGPLRESWEVLSVEEQSLIVYEQYSSSDHHFSYEPGLGTFYARVFVILVTYYFSFIILLGPVDFSTRAATALFSPILVFEHCSHHWPSSDLSNWEYLRNTRIYTHPYPEVILTGLTASNVRASRPYHGTYSSLAEPAPLLTYLSSHPRICYTFWDLYFAAFRLRFMYFPYGSIPGYVAAPQILKVRSSHQWMVFSDCIIYWHYSIVAHAPVASRDSCLLEFNFLIFLDFHTHIFLLLFLHLLFGLLYVFLSRTRTFWLAGLLQIAGLLVLYWLCGSLLWLAVVCTQGCTACT